MAINPILRDLNSNQAQTIEKSDSYAEVVNNNSNLRQEAMDYIQKTGGDPRKAFFTYAKEHNIMPEQAIQAYANKSGMNLGSLLNLIKGRIL